MTTIKNKRLLYMYYNIMKYNFDLSAPPPQICFCPHIIVVKALTSWDYLSLWTHQSLTSYVQVKKTGLGATSRNCLLNS